MCKEHPCTGKTQRIRGRRNALGWFIPALFVAFVAGCSGHPTMMHPDNQSMIDRREIDYPANTQLYRIIENLTAPSAIAFDNEGSILIAENGADNENVRVFGFKKDGSYFEVYPRPSNIPIANIPIPLTGAKSGKIYGPVGGMVFANGKIYLSHRDKEGRGVISTLTYDSELTTLIADLPAQGDHGMTDLAIGPMNGRIYFGVGSVTNSGVVGTDNMPWLMNHRKAHDEPFVDTYLLGRRFDANNPFAGFFDGSYNVVTGPFQPFGQSLETRINPAANHKPNAAIYSIDPNGGDLRVEAHGIRNPVGLGFSEQGLLYFTNQGMKLRGSRPVKDDPDALLRLVVGQWYGWPDYTTDLNPVRAEKYQPPVELLIPSGYRDLSFLIDHENTGLMPPNPNSNLLIHRFSPLSGASKFAMGPTSGPFSWLSQNGQVMLVALWGDRAPFDTSGLKLNGPTGFKIMKVNIDERSASDFIANVQREDGKTSAAQMQRPIDVKFGPDGAIYIVDFGGIRMDKQYMHNRSGAGAIYKLVVGK